MGRGCFWSCDGDGGRRNKLRRRGGGREDEVLEFIGLEGKRNRAFPNCVVGRVKTDGDGRHVEICGKGVMVGGVEEQIAGGGSGHWFG